MVVDKSKLGVMLPAVLFLSTVVFTLALAFLGTRPALMSAVKRQEMTIQAKSLARSGLDDFLAKLNRDTYFPPQLMAGEPTFTYREELGNGYYKVEAVREFERLNGSWDGSNFVLGNGFLRVTSTGYVGNPDDVQAKYQFVAEIDMLPFERDDWGNYNQQCYKMVRFVDKGSL